jgi:hypothetical protein
MLNIRRSFDRTNFLNYMLIDYDNEADFQAVPLYTHILLAL